ncbi:MAG: prephenate dehydratase [Vicinamibacterales bacterium]
MTDNRLPPDPRAIGPLARCRQDIDRHVYDAAYQGEPGAFSEQAAWRLVGRDAALLPCPTLPDVFDAIRERRAAEAVVPVENSLAGTVPRAYELLMTYGLAARAEVRVHIDHMLIAHPSARLSDIKRVLSHPVALDQCRHFIQSHGLAAVPVFDTAGAVNLVMREADRSAAAIASRRAADLHAAAILAEGIQDHDENWTRFLRLSAAHEPGGAIGQKAIVIFELPHTCGSLGRALAHLATLGLNLTKIESRPIPGRPFEYSFIVEMTCGEAPPRWSEWLHGFGSFVSSLQLAGVFDQSS